ncbi:unnamed protein product, partial [Amoebophrya sp. A120]
LQEGNKNFPRRYLQTTSAASQLQVVQTTRSRTFTNESNPANPHQPKGSPSLAAHLYALLGTSSSLLPTPDGRQGVPGAVVQRTTGAGAQEDHDVATQLVDKDDTGEDQDEDTTTSPAGMLPTSFTGWRAHHSSSTSKNYYGRAISGVLVGTGPATSSTSQLDQDCRPAFHFPQFSRTREETTEFLSPSTRTTGGALLDARRAGGPATKPTQRPGARRQNPNTSFPSRA